MKKLLWGSLLVLCIGCSNKSSIKVPKQYKSLKNLKVYSLFNQHSDTMRLQRQRVYGNTRKVPIGRLADVAVDSSGRLYIADGKQRTIDVYAPNGRFLKRLGRQGKGPGEFVILNSLQIDDNKLFAFDYRLQRAVVFALDSLAYDYTVNLGNNRNDFKQLGGAIPHRYYVRKNDTFLIEFLKLHTLSNPVVGDTSRGKGFYYFLNRHGKIASKELFKTKTRIHVMIPVGKHEVGVPFDFYGKLLTSLSDDSHIYVAWSENFLIKIYGPKGTYQRAIYYPFEKVPLTPKSISSDFINQNTLQKMNLPKTWPALHSMLIDDHNRLWISTIVKNQKVYQWWILDKNGKLLARFTWPRDKPIEVIKNEHAYTKEKNPKTGVQQIIRYKIQMQ